MITSYRISKKDVDGRSVKAKKVQRFKANKGIYIFSLKTMPGIHMLQYFMCVTEVLPLVQYHQEHNELTHSNYWANCETSHQGFSKCYMVCGAVSNSGPPL